MAGPTPQRFGNYRLLRRLGAGGMAETWLAERVAQQGVRKKVVLKRILPHRVEQPGFVEMFIDEARLSAALSHGNIAQVFDFGDVEGEYFIELEFVDGLSLAALMRAAEGRGFWHLPYPVAMLIAIDACKGLHHAHTRTDAQGKPLGIVHRDVSPENLVISTEGETKVLDFGVAKAALAGRSETDPGLVKGKHLYFSPEQAVADPLDARSDVYALGIVLYQMLCGARPYRGGTVAAMEAIAAGSYLPPLVANPELPHPLVALLERALAYDREQRTPSAQALLEELSALLVRLNARASNQWVKGFSTWVQFGGDPGSPVSGMLEQWKPGERPTQAEVVQTTRTELLKPASSTRTDRRASRPPQDLTEPGSRGWWWAMGATAVVGAAAALVLTWPKAPVPPATRPPMVDMAIAPPVAVAVPPKPTPPKPEAEPPLAPPVPSASGEYEAAEAPVTFTLGPRHITALDNEILVREKGSSVRVVKWPTASGGNRPLALSQSVRFDPPSGDASRVLQVWLATLRKDGSFAVQRAPGAIDPTLKSWVFSVLAHSEWPSTAYAGSFDSTGDEFHSVELRPTKVLAPCRYTVHSLSTSPAWTIKVSVKPRTGAPAAPILLYAREMPGGPKALLDGVPLLNDMVVLTPGTHRLDSAWWLWVSQVGFAGQPVAPVEISLQPLEAAVLVDPELDAPLRPLPRRFSCKQLGLAPEPGDTPGGGLSLRGVLEQGSFLVTSKDGSVSARRKYQELTSEWETCKFFDLNVSVRAWKRLHPENRGDPAWGVDIKDITVGVNRR